VAGISALPNPFMGITPDHGGLAAVAAELSDALSFLTADPEPPPGPSDTDEIEAILTRLNIAA